MATVNTIVGDDGSNTLSGTAGRDLIYGFDPNGPEADVTSIAATRVASGLDAPLFVTAPPGDTGRLFIVEKTGEIKILDLNTGQLLATPFLNVTVDSAGERGLLGLAFDPDYATNGFFYIYRTVPGSPAHNEVDRYHVSANPNVADVASATPIISLDNLTAASNHNAGWIGFGPEGDLYIATGENGTPSNAQTLSNLLGKVLRIDVHSAAPYAIPADNPFVGTAGARGEIFDFALRNPFRDSFDRGTGDFFIADVGQSAVEEINAGIKGANYGWPIAEGPSSNPDFTNPFFPTITRSARRSLAVMSIGARARGCRASISTPTRLPARCSRCSLPAVHGFQQSGRRRSPRTPARFTTRPRSVKMGVGIFTSPTSMATSFV
jgi:glucose/arabinose dehydrogenase